MHVDPILNLPIAMLMVESALAALDKLTLNKLRVSFKSEQNGQYLLFRFE